MGSVGPGSLAALRSRAGRTLLAELTARARSGSLDDGALLGVLTSLRERYDPALVGAAVTQVRLRERARVKFGADAERMFFTAEGLEQATRAAVADRHAHRFAAAGADRVLDLCCGIGGDLVAAARAGLAVHGVDRDAPTVEVARANADALGLGDRASVEVADVTGLALGGPAAWIDPSRRAGGRRVFDPRGYSPPLAFVERLAAAVPLTGAKVAPGIPHHAVPPGAEAEWVSVDGEVKEAALWFGRLATAPRRATVLPAGVTVVGSTPDPPPVGPPGEWLVEPDGAVIRAGLVGEVVAAVHGGRLLDGSIAYVAADRPPATPLARGWRVTDVLPFSVAGLRALLRARGVGRVTVKKRGSAVDAEALRRQLRLTGSGEAVVVLTRRAGAPTVLVCDPPAARG